MSNIGSGAKAKPAMVTAISIMELVNGILNCIWGMWLIFFVITIPLAAYSIVLGILEIISATKLLPDPINTDKPPRHIAIMEIVNIISLSVPSLVIGILTLVFYEDPKVKEYFQSRKGQVA